MAHQGRWFTILGECIVNRRTFFEAAEIELERWKRAPRPLSLMVFDADYFKRINVAHGHATGDAVLQQLAKTLSTTFRQIDVVARIGGEEFAVLLPSTSEEGAAVVAGRLCRLVDEQRVVVDGVSIRFSVSGGVATMDDTTDDLETLMKRADQALYCAKAEGRNRVVCWSSHCARSQSTKDEA